MLLTRWMWIFLSCLVFSGQKLVATIEYPFVDELIDVVIPSAPKDLEILEACIEGIKTNGRKLGRVIVVSNTLLTDSAEWFDERLFPFTKADIALYLCQGNETRAKKFLSEKGSRVGWYYQQLLKLYAPFVIPDISSNVLILDSDTVFLKPVSFLNDLSAGLYVPSTEPYHYPYFRHLSKLVPGLTRVFPEHSGITHHMMFQRCVLEDLFTIVEIHHHMPFWKAFCLCVDAGDLHPLGSGASEYEIYFNFIFSRSDQVEIRLLKRKDVTSLKDIDGCIKEGCDFISCHDWMRKN